MLQPPRLLKKPSINMLIQSIPYLLSLILLAGVCSSSHNDDNQNQQQEPIEFLSPKEYHLMRRYVCEPQTSGTTNSTTSGYTEQQIVDYERILEQLNRSERFKSFRVFDCQREPSAWRFNYIHEVDSDILIKEESIDERLANSIYATLTNKIFNINFFQFNSGNSEQDRLNEKLVAGPQVDDELCGRQLKQIIRSGSQLQSRLQSKRANPADPLRLTDEHIRVARLFDSYGRYESGHLSGRFQSIGSYEQCLSTKLRFQNNESDSSSARIRTRYCWARLSLDKHLDQWSLQRRHKTDFEYAENTISIGICVPESCHSKSFEPNKQLFRQIVSTQFRLPTAMYLDETLELESVFCLVDEDSPFGVPVSGKIWLISCLGWVLLTLYATVWCHRRRQRYNKLPTIEVNNNQLAASLVMEEPADLGHQQTEAFRLGKYCSKLLDALDLDESWRDFMIEKQTSSIQPVKHVQLDALNMLKVFLCFAVVLGHSICFNIGYSMNELQGSQRLDKDPIVIGAFVITLFVDTFFVITGILMTYFTLKMLAKAAAGAKRPQQQQFHGTGNYSGAVAEFRATRPAKELKLFGQYWLMFTLTRYMRIVPLFALVYWFKRSVYIYLGSGPYWDHGFNRLTKHGACLLEPWYTPLTYLTAYYPLSRQCLLQSWSISNDLFFCLFAPPIVLLLFSRPRLASLLGAFACLGSLALGLAATGSIDPQFDWEMHELHSYGMLRIYNIFSHLYTRPLFRVPSIMFGILAGYKLHHYNERIKFQEWPKWFRGPTTVLSLVCILVVAGGVTSEPYWREAVRPLQHHVYPHSLTTFRSLWSLANAIVFLRMMTDWKDSRLIKMCSVKFWKIFSRLNYAILLLHLDLVMLNYQISTTTFVYSRWQMLVFATSTYFLCIPLSILVHVIFENPFDKLTGLILFGRKNK